MLGCSCDGGQVENAHVLHHIDLNTFLSNSIRISIDFDAIKIAEKIMPSPSSDSHIP